jgi:hypothetical protein
VEQQPYRSCTADICLGKESQTTHSKFTSISHNFCKINGNAVLNIKKCVCGDINEVRDRIFLVSEDYHVLWKL